VIWSLDVSLRHFSAVAGWRPWGGHGRMPAKHPDRRRQQRQDGEKSRKMLEQHSVYLTILF
jgi:hypothetical protein